MIVEKGKKSRPRTEARDMGLIGRPEETNVVHKGVEERYHGTTGEGSEEDALGTHGERPVEVETKIPIVGTNKDRRFRAHQPETPDIVEASPSGACTIEGKASTDSEDPMAMDKSGAGRRDPFTPSPEKMIVGPESPRDSQGGKGGGEVTRSEGRKEGEKGKVDPERLSSCVLEIMAVGPDRPRESRGKEGDSKRTRIDSLKECKWKGPPASNKRIVIVGPESPRVVEYECIIAVFILSLWTGQVWAISVNSIKGSCPKIVTI